MKKVIILGASGGCLDIVDIIEKINSNKNEIEILGILDDKIKNIKDKKYKVIGSFNDIKKFEKYNDIFYATAIGNENNFTNRKKIILNLKIKKKKFINLIHPSANLAKNVKIGHGNIIHNNVSISRSVIIKNFCLLLPAVVIGHDSKIGSFNILNASSTLGGFVNLGENCYLGQGSNLRDKIKVSKQSLIGMGSIITKNIKKKGKYFGII
jgi:sugar O-acyltransferase (sialic acid O-acetyltransferase NeuD family)